MNNTISSTNYEAFEFKVSYKRSHQSKFKITSSHSAYQYLRPLYGSHIDWKESAYLLCLDRANAIIGHYRISEGGIAGTMMDPKIILGIALKAQASGIILSHNHPSGNLNPSQADVSITRKIKQACELLDMSLLDHIIMVSEEVSHTPYYSFIDQGAL